MKKNVYTAISFAVVALFSACSSDDDMLTSVEENQGITIIANLPQNGITRVAYEDTSDGSTYGVKETWQSDDKPKLCWTEDNSTYKQGNYSVNVETGALSGFRKTPSTDSYLYLYYPNSVTSSYGDSKLTISPTGQAGYIFSTINEVAANNLLLGSFQYKSTDDRAHVVEMQNAYALLKFSVKVPTTEAKIKNITIGGLNDGGTGREDINCRGKIVMTESAISFSDLATGAVQSSTGVEFSLTGDGTYKEVTFYALVIPQKFTNGLYLELKDAANAKYNYLKDGTVTLEGGKMYGVKAKVAKVE